MKLSVKGLAFAAGVFWGVSLGVWTLVLSLTDITYGKALLELLVGTYPYYEISTFGALIGAIAGFIDGAVCGAIFAWLYNVFSGNND